LGATDVRLERVTKRFHDVVAVDDLSLDIERGEFFSLLGPRAAARRPRCAWSPASRM
jgi:ABC-type sugar transport system ATPase subunit